jgi:hypothetical protein
MTILNSDFGVIVCSKNCWSVLNVLDLTYDSSVILIQNCLCSFVKGCYSIKAYRVVRC